MAGQAALKSRTELSEMIPPALGMDCPKREGQRGGPQTGATSEGGSGSSVAEDWEIALCVTLSPSGNHTVK